MTFMGYIIQELVAINIECDTATSCGLHSGSRAIVICQVGQATRPLSSVCYPNTVLCTFTHEGFYCRAKPLHVLQVLSTLYQLQLLQSCYFTSKFIRNDLTRPEILPFPTPRCMNCVLQYMQCLYRRPVLFNPTISNLLATATVEGLWVEIPQPSWQHTLLE